MLINAHTFITSDFLDTDERRKAYLDEILSMPASEILLAQAENLLVLYRAALQDLRDSYK